MEVTRWGRVLGFIRSIAWKNPIPFTKKMDLNLKLIAWVVSVIVGLAVGILLILPAPKPKEKSGGGFGGKGSMEPPKTTPAVMQASGGSTRYPFAAPNYGNGGLSPYSSGQKQANTRNLNSAMVMPRPGVDSKTQLPPGTRFPARVIQTVVVSKESMPFIAEVASDIVHESEIAIPRGSKLLGEVGFDEEGERARVSWKAIIFPDGRQREISAQGLGVDGQLGVSGQVHSDAVKNTIGQTLTRFVGAFAQGSMSRNWSGQSEGGATNGLYNAVGETAQDRAQALGEGLKKERKWIEIVAGSETLAVLSAPFVFQDSGGIH